MFKLAFILAVSIIQFHQPTDNFVSYRAKPNQIAGIEIELQDGKNTIDITGSTKADFARNTKMTCEFIDPFAKHPLAVIKNTYDCKISTTIALPTRLVILIKNIDKEDAYYNIRVNNAN